MAIGDMWARVAML